MNKEIVTDPLSPEDLWQDLKTNIKMFKALGISQVLVLYGFSWGSHFYDDNWEDLPVDVDKFEDLLIKAMEKGYGALGHDNLYISIPRFNMKLQYSHETDIHISFGDNNELVRTIHKRWEDAGWLQYIKKVKQMIH